MSDWLSDYGMFLAQIVTLMAAIVLLIALSTRMRGGEERSRLRIEELNTRYRSRERRLRLTGMDKKRRKAALKAFKKEDKREGRARHDAGAQPHGPMSGYWTSMGI